LKVAFGYGSDARVRGDNQDALGVFEVGDTILGVVCDGVGGHTGGQQAATLAVRTVAQSLQDGAQDLQSAVVEAITLANRTIYETGRKSHRLMGMSTTIVAVAIRGDLAVVAHVGDSRAYLLRNGVMTALTRDHTMVNMFVDNDLLSAEDAASHPEAHVLARSLGSERQVDIDVHPVIQLQDGDSLLLCSDGVHNTLDEQDLAIDWTRPGLSARQLLRKVAAHGGSDNASLIGFRIGGRGEPGMAFTELPSMEQSGDALTPSSSDMVHAPNLLDEPMPPALYPIEPEDEPTYHPDDPTTSIPGAPLIPQQRSATPRPVPRTPAPAPPRPDKKRKKRRGPSKAVLIAVSALVLCLIILGAAFAYRVTMGGQPAGPAVASNGNGNGNAGVAGTNGQTSQDAVEVVPPEPVPLDSDASAASTDPPAQDEGSVTVAGIGPGGPGDIELNPPAGAWAYVRFPQLPSNTKTKIVYDKPPSHPEHRQKIRKLVNAPQPDCSQVEAIVAQAVDESTDNAGLYEDLWLCYQDRHHRQLSGTLDDYYAFSTVQPHLEGAPRQEDGTRLPYWLLPATDGVERRMDLFAEHFASKDRDALFDDVVQDAIDRRIVAANFSHDLQAEAAYATAFKRLRNPSPGEVQHWARRVYTIRKHLDSPVGDLIEDDYPQSYNRLRGLLADVTNDFEDTFRDAQAAWLTENRNRDAKEFPWRELAVQEGLDPEVAHALLTAAGRVERPDAKKIADNDKPKGPKIPKGPKTPEQTACQIMGTCPN